jgi:hypothetical protein
MAAAMLMLAASPACRAQYPAYGNPYYQTPAPMYQPMMTSLVFQESDGGVPLPGDAAATPATSGSVPSTSAPMSVDGGTGPMMMDPGMGQTMYMAPELMIPQYQDGTTWNAFSPVAPQDPFLMQPGAGDPAAAPYAPYAPYGGYQQSVPAQGAFGYGANVPQPYRFGWQNRVDLSWMPGGDVKAAPGGATGDHEIFGVDYDLAYGSPFIPGWVLNWTNQFSYRNWNGPDGAIGLPSDLFRFGIDLELETPRSGPFSLSLGATPSINTDFDGDTWGDGFQIDGRGIIFMQLDQYWTLGLGAMYWDRVDDRVIPWAGLIYRDDYWEWQLMYPEARVSLFLGNETHWSKWAYVRAEYHVEAYGVNRSFAGVSRDDQVEIEDYRILLGLKMDSGLYSWFIEGGWVFDRQVEFDSNIPGYDIDTGFIGQIGLRY